MWAEWHVMAPWGRIRSKSAPPRSSYTNAEIMANELEPLRHVTSTGDIRGIPVLLAHGRKDCAATFTPLLKHQPGEIFYYVAVDMPGSSTSDPLPKNQQDSCIPLQDHSVFGPGYFQQPQQSVKIMRFHFLAAMEVAIQHLGWDKFIFMGHSMGCEIGLFYNAIYPGRMTKMVLLDAEPALRRLQVQDLAEYQAMFYDDYYENYEKHNNYYKLYTIPEAKQALMRARNLPEEAASIIADSSLIHVAGDKYRFSWDYRLTLPAAQNYPNSYYFALFSNIPPTLLISASNSLNAKSKYRPGSIELLNMMSRLKNFSQVVVEGDHDVHLSHPERVAPYVNEFLTKSVVLPSKL